MYVYTTRELQIALRREGEKDGGEDKDILLQLGCKQISVLLFLRYVVFLFSMKSMFDSLYIKGNNYRFELS